jgi:hypothetical protein
MPTLAHLPLFGRLPRDPRIAPALETALLRKSVGALAAGRHRCHHCRRTPLVGERVHLYAERMVCDLCRSKRREAPERTVLVRSPEHAQLVHPVAGAA